MYLDHPLNWISCKAPARPRADAMVNLMNLTGYIRTWRYIADPELACAVLEDPVTGNVRYWPTSGAEHFWWAHAIAPDTDYPRIKFQRKMNQMASDFNGEFSGEFNAQGDEA